MKSFLMKSKAFLFNKLAIVIILFLVVFINMALLILLTQTSVNANEYKNIEPKEDNSTNLEVKKTENVSFSDETAKTDKASQTSQTSQTKLKASVKHNMLYLKENKLIEAKEIEIQWDEWRRAFNHAVWVKFCQALKGGNSIMIANRIFKFGNAPGMNFQSGLKAVYYCEINNMQHIVSVRILKSSGNQAFDELVMNSVQALDGKNILEFPSNSSRTVISESQQLYTTAKGTFEQSPRNDIERYLKANN